MSTEPWKPFGIPDEDYQDARGRAGFRVLNLTMRRPRSERKVGKAREGGDQAATSWLRSALIGLGVLAGAAAAVSFTAQYQLVFAAKGIPWAAALEAGVPDAGSMVFACLGIALALKGKRALRARGGNLACVGLSLTMNLLAATAGWRGVAIWVMPSAVYAFASDTLIGVIRAHVLASQGRTDNEKTALAAIGGLLLWTLRLVLAPPSTLGGFRMWVVESCPVAPGRRAELATASVAALPAAETPGSAAITLAQAPARSRGARETSKRAQLIEAYEALAGIDARYGDRTKASQVAKELAAKVGMQWGSARTVLYRHLDARAEASS